MRFIPMLLALLSCAATATVSAQNVVPNPSFVVYDTCPSSHSQINRCTSWRSPNTGTPDYFNACVSVGVSVPANVCGYQASADNAYTGAYSFVQGGGQPEYLTTDIPALVVGKTYTVSITVSLADSSTYGCDGLGVFFYIAKKPDSAMPALIPFTPQVNYSSLGPVTDKTNWVKLSKVFVADSAYTHMVVGSFKSEATLIKVLDSAKAASTALTPFAYYYFDSVIVESMPVGISDPLRQLGVTVYPNPFTNNCTFRIGNPNGAPCELSIFNIQGALIRKIDNITANDVVIEREDMQNGIYYYHLRTPENTVTTGKVVVY